LIAKAVEFIHKTLKGIQIFMFSTVTDQQGILGHIANFHAALVMPS